MKMIDLLHRRRKRPLPPVQEQRVRRELDPRPMGCDCGRDEFTPDAHGRWLCPCGLRY